MKKVLSLAAAGLLTAGIANAGTITVANTDLTFYGGVSVGYLTQDNDLFTGTNQDNIRIMTAALGLQKEATANSPIGVNFALAQFEVPTLLASNEVVNNKGGVLGAAARNNSLLGLGQTDDGLQIWLSEVDVIVPNTGFKVSGGLLWSKYGERPITILNNHINRGLMYVFFNPVAYTGVRAEFQTKIPALGEFDVYAGYNQANGLALIPDALVGVVNDPKDAYEVGASGTFNLGITKLDAKLHYYDEAGGRNIWTLCTGLNFKDFIKGGLQFSYATKDDKLKDAVKNAGLKNVSDNYWGVGLNFNVSLLDAQIANVEFPMRLEYVKLDIDGGDGDSNKDKVWSFTITPTWKPTKNTFVRAEYTYTKADSQIFKDTDDGTADDTRSTIALEAGFLF